MTDASTVHDAVTMEADYQRRAKAAVAAANAALGPQWDTATRAAKIEAVGRIASALILADRGQP